MKVKNTMRRLAAGVGSLALALAGAVAMGTAASAEQGTDGTAPGNADEGTTGTLNIFKYAGTTTQDVNENNGTAQTIARPPLAGVQFTVCKVADVDLTDPADWDVISDLDADSVVCEVGTSSTDTTDVNGEANFSDLEIGLYMVVESSYESAGVTTPAAPFLVSIPYPSVSTVGEGDDAKDVTTWLWTVNTYPKNTIDSDEGKTVADPETHGLGSWVDWTITSRTIGTIDGGADFTEYSLIDSLHDNLRYEETTSFQVHVPGAIAADVDDEYYEITPDSAAIAGGGEVVLEFTDSGIVWLNSLQAGTYFTWDLTTEVVGVGALDNKSFENTGGVDFKTGEATTDWGGAKLVKHEAGDPEKTLADAEFQVFDVPTDGSCELAIADAGTPIEVDGKTTFVSDADGVVTIAGLYVGKDGDPASRDYCVYETKAPQGYTAITTPILITVEPGAMAEADWSLVPNPPVEGPDLPLTGAQGTLAMTIGGLLLVGTGAGALVVSRRRRHNEA